MAYVKDEKANAMTSFQWKRNLEIILILFNVCAALWFFSRSSWFPITVQAFWYSYVKLMLIFNNTFYTFLLLNAILLSLYALSNNKSDASGDLYHEFLNHRESHFKISESISTENEKQTGPVTEDSSDKPVTSSEVGETVTAVTETTTTTSCCTTVSTKSTSTSGEKKNKVSGQKCFRRVQSESIERRVMVTPRRQFRRYNTSSSRQLQGRLCYVEQLSKEEFNRAVEEFISKHKRMQLEEQRESERTECLGFTR